MDELDKVLAQFHLKDGGDEDNDLPDPDDGDAPVSASVRLEEMLQNLGLITEEHRGSSLVTSFQKAMDDEENFCDEEKGLSPSSSAPSIEDSSNRPPSPTPPLPTTSPSPTPPSPSPSPSPSPPSPVSGPPLSPRSLPESPSPSSPPKKPQGGPPKATNHSGTEIRLARSATGEKPPMSPSGTFDRTSLSPRRPPPPSRTPPPPAVEKRSCYYDNGDWYTGEVQTDTTIREGRGVYWSSTGIKYEGQFLNSKMSGAGKLTYPNGDVYEGEFLDDKFHGNGKYTRTDGSFISGAFSNGQLCGEATSKFENGDLYEGNMKDGAFDGQGKYSYQNGDVLVCSFVGGRPLGQGEYSTAEGVSHSATWTASSTCILSNPFL